MGSGSWDTRSFVSYSTSKGYGTDSRGVVTGSYSNQEMFKAKNIDPHQDTLRYGKLNLCEFIGASTPHNVVACAMDLGKFNHLTMGRLFKKYEPVEDE